MLKGAIPWLVLVLSACTGDDGGPLDVDEEWGMNGPLEPTPPPGKEDSELRRGLYVNTDTSRTQVWTARNKWEDTDTAAAKKAGLAWAANSGLTWDQKYAKWVESLEWIPALNGYSTTFQLTTPWGKTFPSPSLECAEMSLFLRISFAAWYELPLFLEAQDASGTRVYFGHNGVRTQTGRYASSPEFGIKYKDYSAAPPASWPKDTTLRGKRLAGGEDVQDMIAPGATFGAYLDEVHLNKRAGYFIVMALDYLGSVNLADSANTYNIVADDVRPGDTLIERWQPSGIGHTLVVKQRTPLPGGSLDVSLISGSIPRRQGVRESGQASKSYFTSNYTGGPGTTSDGIPYVRLGGGIKRWRVTKNVGGYWTNTWMAADEASWINSTDAVRLSERPARFQQLLGQVSPAQQRTELVQQIENSRRHLSQYPASCAARERRENAFEALYEVSQRAFGMSRAQVDAEYRELEDYVFAELDYTKSKTCCWNSSTAAMFDIVMDQALAEQEAAEAAMTCVAPVVFAARSDGYQRWASYASSVGRSAEWRAWSEDEACAQRNVAADTVVDEDVTPYCELVADEPPPACTDAMEPNDVRTEARAVSGTVDGLQICASDEDWFKLAAGGTVKIAFTHASGDLDVTAYDASGIRIGSSESTNNEETVTVPAGGYIRVYGYSGARNTYRLIAP
jgi:hypothetical protein